MFHRKSLVASAVALAMMATALFYAPPSVSASAGGCSGGNECIYVSGSGLYVSYTTATYQWVNSNPWATRCGYQKLTKGGSVWKTGPYQCVRGDGLPYVYTFWLTQSLPNLTTLCVYFTADPDKPCETVHK